MNNRGGHAPLGAADDVIQPPRGRVEGDDVVLSVYEPLTSTTAPPEREHTPVATEEDKAAARERALVEEAKHNAEAFGKLYQQYVRRIYNYFYRHTGNQTEAEDLTSHTFYCALRSIRQYKDKGGSFQAWLFRIAHNLAVNWYRDQSRHRVISLEGDAHHTGQAVQRDEPYEKIVRTELEELVMQLIDQLPEIRKTLLILKFVEKMPNEEIATVLGKTEGAIKSLYHRTLLDLRETLQQGEYADVFF
ncbi:MAG TPA: RNA polymerase sigma factor [Anaerolineae bacterium]|nr:RNA polymerase sigma factor [Anaerolineae bacterium]HQH38996.1 RNA polymerase sigma factor [Anaerolineae bacterium]